MNAATTSRERDRRACWAIVGKLKKAGIAGDQIKSDLTILISGGRTEHSSALSDRELSRLRLDLQLAARQANVDPLSPKAKPADGAPRSRRPAAAEGLTGLRSPQQKQLIDHLTARLLYGPEKRAALLKKSPSSQQAAATIERLKSQLVRHSGLLLRLYALRRLPVFAELPTDQRRLVDDLLARGSRGGRAINRLPVGGVLWALDVVTDAANGMK